MQIKNEYRDYFLKRGSQINLFTDELDEDKYTKHMLRHLANDNIESGSEILATELSTNIERFDFAIKSLKLFHMKKISQ